MSVSNAQFAASLLDDQAKRVVLCELSYLFEGSSTVNVARDTAGATAVGSTELGPQWAAAKAINGEIAGTGWGTLGTTGGWADNTTFVYPDYLTVTFGATYAINKIVLYSMQDTYLSPSAPTDTMVGTLWAISDFEVQALIGGTWVTQATITGNNLIKRTVTFAGVSTTAIRIKVNGTQDAAQGYTRIVELEAYPAIPIRSTVYLSNRPYSTEPGDTPSNVEYRASIISIPSFTRSIDAQTFGGRMTVTVDSLVIDNADGRCNFLLDLIIDGEDVTVLLGGDGYAHADFRQMFVAVAVKAEQKGTTIAIRLKDKSYIVDKSIVRPLIGGPGPNAQRFVPRIIGSYYAEALLVDAATSKYIVCGNDLGPVEIEFLFTDGVLNYPTNVVGPSGIYTDNGDGTLTLNVAQGSAQLIALVLVPALSAGFTLYRHPGEFLNYYWNTEASRIGLVGSNYGAHSSWGGTATLPGLPGSDFALCIDEYLTDRYNVAERMDQVALSANGFWGVRRDGKMTYGRIRPHKLYMDAGEISTGADSTFGTPRYTLTDDDVIGEVDTVRLDPQYNVVNVRFAKHATFNNLAYLTPPVAQGVWRDEFLRLSTASYTQSDYADAPDKYHLSMTASPEFEILAGFGNLGFDISQIYVGGPFTPANANTTVTGWAQWRRDMVSPHIELRTVTGPLREHYDIELGDVIATNMPTKAFDTADTLWQVLSVAMNLTDFRLTLVLVRRRTPSLTQIIEGATSTVALPTLHGNVYATQLLAGNRVFDTQKV